MKSRKQKRSGTKQVPLSTSLSCRLFNARVVFVTAITEFEVNLGSTLIAARAELSSKGARSASNATFNSGGESSGKTGWTSR